MNNKKGGQVRNKDGRKAELRREIRREIRS
jgi:hypothetical protein